MDWAARYIGIPFLDGGRGEDGCDCWGLVRLIYGRELGIFLPSYGETSAFDLAQVARHMKAGAAASDWIDPQEPGEFDVALMRRNAGGAMPAHVGLLTADGRVLHVERGTDAVAVPRRHFSVAKRILFFRRHRTRNDAASPARSGEARSERGGGLERIVQPRGSAR